MADQSGLEGGVVIDWDDLRIFTVSARSGSFAAAAARLGMDATTVGRHVQRLESTLKCTLFVRTTRGLKLTQAGARLEEAGIQVEAAIQTAGETETGSAISGNVRLSASAGFGTYVLAPAIGELLDKLPNLTIELYDNQGFLSPSTREVDLAITLSPPQAGRVYIEPLTDYELGLYGSPSYLAKKGVPKTIDDLDRFAFVGYITDLVASSEFIYLNDIRPNIEYRVSSSSIRAQLGFIAGGVGLGVVPCFMAEEFGTLQRVLPDKVRIIRTLWVSIHQDLKSVPRIKATRRWIASVAEDNRALLMPSSNPVR